MNTTEEKAQQINDLGHGPSSVHDRTGANKGRTEPKSGTPLTRARSGLVRFYELIDNEGNRVAIFRTALEAAAAGARWYPGQEQDPNRTGAGWDVQVVP